MRKTTVLMAILRARSAIGFDGSETNEAEENERRAKGIDEGEESAERDEKGVPELERRSLAMVAGGAAGRR